jgi:hypothetical protein
LLKLLGTDVQHNTVASWGGGIRLLDNSAIAAVNSSIIFNTARIGGGIASGPNTSAVVLPMLLSVVSSNSAAHGPDVAVDPISMQFVDSNTTFDYVSRAAADDGALDLKLSVSGAMNLPAPGMLAAVSLDGTHAHSLGANTSDDAGIVHLLLRVRKPPGKYTVSVKLPEFVNVSSANTSLQVRGCMPGEVAPIPNTCEPCLPGFYSLDPSQAVCDVCPAGATCPGGAAMVPLLGWWQQRSNLSTDAHVR